jgi:hypothetical protein
LRFFGGLGEVEGGEEILEEGGEEERRDEQAVLLLHCGAGRLARRVVTTTGDIVDAPDLETLDGEKKLRSEDDLALGDDNITIHKSIIETEQGESDEKMIVNSRNHVLEDGHEINTSKLMTHRAYATWAR